MLTDETITYIAFFGVLLLSLSWHEAAHAWVADKLGDPTARELGRVTLNPLKHLDPFLSVILPVVLFLVAGVALAGGKPVPVRVQHFKRPTRDFMFVALAGPGSNILMALLFGLLLVVATWAEWVNVSDFSHLGRPDIVSQPSLAREPESTFELVLHLGVLLNVALAMFNLIPIPPLDGSRVIGWLLPRVAQRAWYSLDRVGIVLVLLLIYGFDGIDQFMGLLMGVIREYDVLLIWLMDHNPLA